MDRPGLTAVVAMMFAGRAATDPGREVDLTVDAAGDPLAVDSADDPLIAVPAVLWTGRTASETP